MMTLMSVYPELRPPGSCFTAMFEALLIDWLYVVSTSVVAECIELSWNAVDGFMNELYNEGFRDERPCR